ncbi:tetratricopeptide repeat protein [Hymenobacter fodinae]|nr:tetratricopeptide repeat protein [Hymenobacter fodinae]
MLLLSSWGGLTRIHDRNDAIRRGELAYARKDYSTAAEAYKEAAVRLGSQEDQVWLNLAHATARLGRSAEARGYYGHLLTSSTPATRSIALQQLAILATQKGDYAQATTLLRQALIANPRNADARFNYEVLRDYLTRRATDPQMPPPGTDGSPDVERHRTPEADNAERQPQPKPGADQQGQLNDPTQPQDPRNAPQSQPNAQGKPAQDQPSGNAGNSAPNGFTPGRGEQREMASGQQPGSVKGLSNEETGPEAPGGTSNRGGTEQAALDEAQLQTQRARLQQMNLSAGQARQLLDAMHAAEQQYLQQLPRKSTRPADKSKPGW